MADLIPTIRELIRDGFGVEDIAIQLEIPVDRIRLMTRRWQEAGVIKAILRPPNYAADTQRQLRTGLTEALTHQERMSDG